MLEFFDHLFDTTGFPPRWYCGSWTPLHGWLHILSDLGVWSAYVAIPGVLGFFVLRRRDIPFRPIFWLFGLFILACGTTHLIEAGIFWWPVYRFAGVVKFLTAVVSWATVIALVPVTPRALAMRSPQELEREIEERKRAEAELRMMQAELEQRVANRTAELAQANEALRLEIAERERAERSLREHIDEIETLMEVMPIAIWRAHDAQCRRITGNRVSYQLLRLPPQRNVSKSAPPEEVPTEYKNFRNGVEMPVEELPLQHAARTGTEVRDVEFSLVFEDGSANHLYGYASPLFGADGQVRGAVAAFIDITERKKAEEELRREVAQRQAAEAELRRYQAELEQKIQERTAELTQVNARLARSLDEKEVLLREIHHRVKNNLQIVSSLLQMQAQQTADEALRETLRESQNRVRSMALVHERLYQSRDLAKVNFAEYLRSLAGSLYRSYRANLERIRLTILVRDVHLPIDTAVPCGLAVSELVSNCLKYAFPEGRSGEIRIELLAGNDRDICLCVADNGVGLPPDVDLTSARTFGLRLVGALVGQLRGKAEIERKAGTTVRITFPMIR